MLSLDEKVKAIFPDYQSIGDLVQAYYNQILIMPSLGILEMHSEDFNIYYLAESEEWNISLENKNTAYYLSNQQHRYLLHCDLASWLTAKVLKKFDEMMDESNYSINLPKFGEG